MVLTSIVWMHENYQLPNYAKLFLQYPNIDILPVFVTEKNIKIGILNGNMIFSATRVFGILFVPILIALTAIPSLFVVSWAQTTGTDNGSGYFLGFFLIFLIAIIFVITRRRKRRIVRRAFAR